MQVGGTSRYGANAITASRVALTPIFVWCLWRATRGESGWPAAVLFAAAACSDFIDGPVARRFGTASQAGRLLDHGADIGFILSALIAYSILGMAPWWVPAAIGLSFAVYVADSWVRSGGARPSLIASRIGHVAGVLNYVLVGVLVGNETVGFAVLPSWLVNVLFWLVPLYSGTAVVARFIP